jgi:hypothetical protein
MTKNNVRIASVVMPVIAMLLLFAGSSRAMASDQTSTANVAIKIDNRVLGPQAITVPAHVDCDGFPKLANAIKATNWPVVVQNHKDCYMPSTVGGDYSGDPCTGTLIAATLNDNCDVPTSAREDYSDPQCTPATGDQTTIILDLTFLYTVPEPSVGMLSENSKAR